MDEIKSINIDGCAIVILDNNLFDSTTLDVIIEKIKSLNLKYVFNTVAYGAKVVESCYELIQEQARKMDKLPTNLPLIILKNKPNDFIYSKELSKIKGINDIMKELLEDNLNTKYKYIILTKDYTSLYLDIDDSDIYISIKDFLNLESVNVFETKGFPTYENNTSQIELTDIVYTYLAIMKKVNGLIEKLEEYIYQIIFKEYKFKLLLINSYKDLYNEDIEISDYDLIIESSRKELQKTNILESPDVVSVYQMVKHPGLKFKE